MDAGRLEAEVKRLRECEKDAAQLREQLEDQQKLQAARAQEMRSSLAGKVQYRFDLGLEGEEMICGRNRIRDSCKPSWRCCARKI